MVYWITGKQGAGKTTLAEKISETFWRFNQANCILDGDAVRFYLGNLPYTSEGRMENIKRIIGIAEILKEQNIIPIIALVSPYEYHRDSARAAFPDLLIIHVTGGTLWEGTVYEEPENPWWKYDWSFDDGKIAEKLGLL
jgi:adenylylsulfate kinase-like enzyme